MGKHGDAMRLYSGRDLKDRARMWVRLHKRMSDYLQQAPVLILAEDDPNTRITLHRACERGAKLREVMEACGFNVGLRKVHPYALQMHEAPTGFVKANPSAVAQQIANRSIDGQREFLKQINVYAFALRSNMNQDRGVPVSWMAENLPKGNHDMRHYADIPASMLDECGFRRNWRWRDFKAAIHRWEESFTQPARLDDLLVYGQRMYTTNARGQREVVEWGNVYNPFDRTSFLRAPLTPHNDAPAEASEGDLSFHLLNTPAELAEEGHAMQHCVGGYSQNVRSGYSLIYSIRKYGERLATMELSPSEWDAKTGQPPKPTGWHITQIKAVRNADPSAHVLLATKAFAAAHFRLVDPKPIRWAIPIRMVSPDRVIYYNATA